MAQPAGLPVPMPAELLDLPVNIVDQLQGPSRPDLVLHHPMAQQAVERACPGRDAKASRRWDYSRSREVPLLCRAAETGRFIEQ